MVLKRRSKTVGLGMLPEYRKPDSDDHERGAHLLAYFCGFLQQELADCAYVELPSIHQLSQYFQCSYMFFYDTLRRLNGAGFDYSFSSLDGAVQVWKKE